MKEKIKPIRIDREKTAAHLDELCKSSGLEKKEIARAIEISPQALSKYTVGKCLPTPEHLYRLSLIFNTTVDELLIPEKNK